MSVIIHEHTGLRHAELKSSHSSLSSVLLGASQRRVSPGEGTTPEKQESRYQASVLCSSRDFFLFSLALREVGTLLLSMRRREWAPERSRCEWLRGRAHDNHLRAWREHPQRDQPFQGLRAVIIRQQV